jgi:hypothetical protein
MGARGKRRATNMREAKLSLRPVIVIRHEFDHRLLFHPQFRISLATSVLARARFLFELDETTNVFNCDR